MGGLNWTLALLVHYKIMTEEEAEHLSKKLTESIHPHMVKDAIVRVEQLLAEYNKKK